MSLVLLLSLRLSCDEGRGENELESEKSAATLPSSVSAKKPTFFTKKRNMKAVNFTLACHTLKIWFWPFFVEKQNVGCISASFVIQS